MERRALLKGAFGLVVLATGAVAGQAWQDARTKAYFTTAEPATGTSLVGPAMRSGISLVRDGDCVHGMAGDLCLFDVDALGAELVERADGSLTLDELAQSASVQTSPADVASFFVTLGRAGYLQNKVYVNLVELPA